MSCIIKLCCIIATQKCIKNFFQIFSNGDTRDQATTHDGNRATLLRLKDRQAEPPELSVPRGQDTELPSVLQNPDGLLL